LKPCIWRIRNMALNVAPRRGAWIETLKATHKPREVVSRTPQGCVD